MRAEDLWNSKFHGLVNRWNLPRGQRRNEQNGWMKTGEWGVMETRWKNVFQERKSVYIGMWKKWVIKEFNEEVICKGVSNVKEYQQGILKNPRASNRLVLPAVGRKGHGERERLPEPRRPAAVKGGCPTISQLEPGGEKVRGINTLTFLSSLPLISCLFFHWTNLTVS